MADYYTIEWSEGQHPVAVPTPILREDARVIHLAAPVVLPNGSERRIILKANLPIVPDSPEAAARLELGTVTDRLIEARVRLEELEVRTGRLQALLDAAEIPCRLLAAAPSLRCPVNVPE